MMLFLSIPLICSTHFLVMWFLNNAKGARVSATRAAIRTYSSDTDAFPQRKLPCVN